jgi:hypothetical protein
MLIFFNWPGLGLAVSGFLLGVLTTLVGASTSLCLVVAGLVNFVADIFLRSRKGTSGCGRYFYPRAGGNIMFIPSWILGVVFGIPGWQLAAN